MKKDVYCPVCTALLGRVHGKDVANTISTHLIWNHTEVAKQITVIALMIEEYQEEFKRLSDTSSSDALHHFANQNTMRKLGWSEKEINEHMKRG